MTKSYTEYGGMFIFESDHCGAAPGQHGFVVSDRRDGFTNAMPGATYALTHDGALQLIDVFKVVDGDGQKFWHLLNAIRREGASPLA